MPSFFAKLTDLSKQATYLQSLLGLLEWDQETYMPKAAAAFRAEQLEYLSGLFHKSRTSSSYQKALSSLIDLETGKIKDETLSQEEKACLREWKRDFLLTKKLPIPFVKQYAKTTSEALSVWIEAKEKSDFSLFAPHLSKIVSLSRKKASFLGYKEHPYDALLDLYEPGLTVSTLRPLFSSLKKELKTLLHSITPRPPLSLRPFSKEKQKKLGDLILEKMGFDPTTSRLDLSSHPFCSGLHPRDIRMTTRINENDPLSSLFSVLHEGGHGLYHTNLPQQWFGTPLCEPASFGIDESQSRFWETLVGKSMAFWRFFYPTLQSFFPDNLNSISLEEFYRHVNRIEPSMIRVEADEVTYSLHIILRFELEVGLIEGSIKPSDIPHLWNQHMQESLGITPANDREGCLQDIHWAMGGIGYFPSYVLGNLLAAELFSLIEKEHKDLQERIASGDFSFLVQWLKTHIHEKGRFYTPSDLIKTLTGKPLSSESYIRYLRQKHLH